MFNLEVYACSVYPLGVSIFFFSPCEGRNIFWVKINQATLWCWAWQNHSTKVVTMYCHLMRSLDVVHLIETDQAFSDSVMLFRDICNVKISELNAVFTLRGIDWFKYYSSYKYISESKRWAKEEADKPWFFPFFLWEMQKFPPDSTLLQYI